MTRKEIEEMRKQNDWRPYHFIADFNAYPTYQLIEFDEIDQANAAEETTAIIFGIIESC